MPISCNPRGIHNQRVVHWELRFRRRVLQGLLHVTQPRTAVFLVGRRTRRHTRPMCGLRRAGISGLQTGTVRTAPHRCRTARRRSQTSGPRPCHSSSSSSAEPSPIPRQADGRSDTTDPASFCPPTHCTVGLATANNGVSLPQAGSVTSPYGVPAGIAVTVTARRRPRQQQQQQQCSRSTTAAPAAGVTANVAATSCRRQIR